MRENLTPRGTAGLPGRCLLAAAVLSAACGFSPRVPDGTVVCAQDSDCPAGLLCSATPAATGARLCCREGVCPVPGGDDTDAGRAAPPNTSGPPPMSGGSTPDAGADPGPSAFAACSMGEVRPPLADEKVHCTIAADDSAVGLGVDIIARNDPLTTFTEGSCQADLRLGDEAVDPATGAGRALSQPALDNLVRAVQRMQQFCRDARGTIVGMVGGSWARKITNAPDVLSRLQADTGLTMDVPDEKQALTQRYLGVTRNRRSRIVFDEWLSVPEILIWPTDAPEPTSYLVPTSFNEVGSAFLANAEFATFDQARNALRGRLNNIRYVMVNLARGVTNGTLNPSIAIGPSTNATIPLAIKGELRDAMEGWYEPQRYQTKIDQARVTLSAQGWIYGVVSPAEIDAFFPSINMRDFTQMRSDPVLRLYGEWVTLSSSVLEMLNKEGRASEFVFTVTNSYYGYLFSKLFPAPAAK